MTELAQAVVNGLQIGFLYALVAVGLTIIWGLMEMINFAHGEFLMLGMFGAWWLGTAFGLDPLLAIVTDASGSPPARENRATTGTTAPENRAERE